MITTSLTNRPILERPPWLKKKIRSGNSYYQLNAIIREKGLHTVCKEACCPNQAECYSNGTSTFMILGETCSRNCGFCAVRHGSPTAPDKAEPVAVAEMILEMALKYAVVTSVTRDDLDDGGATHFSSTVAAVRRINPSTRIELLVPDFRGNDASIQVVSGSCPDVLNHNIETVPRLYGDVRSAADYDRSLALFGTAKKYNGTLLTKSGLMLGLGESPEEIEQTLNDLHQAGCDILTLGQYLAPSDKHYPVARYVSFEEFSEWKQRAYEIGFAAVASGPFVRSSYNALSTYLQAVEFKAKKRHE